MLDELGLPRALEEYISGFARRSGLEISFAVAPELREARFEPSVGIALFRVAQEALGNANRHARCTRIDVKLSWADPAAELAVLVIRDNGRGLPPGFITDGSDHGRCEPGGVGIAGMRERLNQIGARLVLTQNAGQGLEVRAVFSLLMTEAPEDSPGLQSRTSAAQTLFERDDEGVAAEAEH